MKPIVVVDAAAIAGGDRLLARGVVSGLLTLKESSDLVLIGSVDVERWREIESILEGEGILFRTRSEADRADVVITSRHPDSLGRGHESAQEIVNPVEIGWEEAARRIVHPQRIGEVGRETSETSISVQVNLDGTGTSSIDTGLGFFDHMLDQIARHSGADIRIEVSGDLDVDEHHTIEDTAIALGEAFGRAIGDKRGIERYSFLLPMDDSLAQVAFDWSGRSWLVWDADFRREKVGDMPTEMFPHFFKSFADAARCNLNIRVSGDNEHHMIESVFKAFGRCLGQASRRREDDDRVPSTKDVL